MGAISYSKNLVYRVTSSFYSAVNISKGIKVLATGVAGYAATNYVSNYIFESEIAKSKMGKASRDMAKGISSTTGAALAVCWYAGIGKWQIVKAPFSILWNMPTAVRGPIDIAMGYGIGSWLGGKFSDNMVVDFGEEFGGEIRLIAEKSTMQTVAGVTGALITSIAFGSLKPLLSGIGSIAGLGIYSTSSLGKVAGQAAWSAGRVVASTAEAKFLATNIAIATGTYLAVSAFYKYKNWEHDSDAIAFSSGVVTLAANWPVAVQAYKLGAVGTVKAVAGYPVHIYKKLFAGSLHYGSKFVSAHGNYVWAAMHQNLLLCIGSVGMHYVIPMGYLQGLDMPYLGFNLIEGIERKNYIREGLRAEVVAINAVKQVASNKLGAKFLADKADEFAGGSVVQLINIIRNKQKWTDEDRDILYAHQALKIAELYEKVLAHIAKTNWQASSEEKGNLQLFLQNTHLFDYNDMTNKSNSRNDLEKLLSMASNFKQREGQLQDASTSIHKQLNGNIFTCLHGAVQVLPFVTAFMPTGPVFATFAASTVAYSAFSSYNKSLSDEMVDYQVTYRCDPSKASFGNIISSLPAAQQNAFEIS